jgi:peptide-methionine (R)-S-oxide reductase
MLTRRHFNALLGTAALFLAAGRARAAGLFTKDNPQEEFAVTMSDEEWKKRLTPEQYRILRKHGTEMAGSSPLNREKHEGVFQCAGCGWPLYSSAQKYDSGTGWPSFWQPINDEAVRTSTDHKLGYARTEVHCAHCGGHLGHVFEDGPPPTGLRYCMNGVAMVFKPVS